MYVFKGKKKPRLDGGAFVEWVKVECYTVLVLRLLVGAFREYLWFFLFSLKYSNPRSG